MKITTMKIKTISTTFIIASLALSCYASVPDVFNLPRPEYPRPQFERADWTNLNGEWSYTLDFGKSGKERDYSKTQGSQHSIIVPFCPESSLSGVGYTDFVNAMRYHRDIAIPQNLTWNVSIEFFPGRANKQKRKYKKCLPAKMKFHNFQNSLNN